MSTKLETLASELETLRSEILDLEQVETPTDEQLARMESIIPEWDTKKADHDRLAERAQKIEAVRSASLHEYNREPTAPEVIINRANKDPFAEMDRVRAGLIDPKELRGRAMDVVEQSERMEDDAKQHVVRMLEGKREGARHSLSKKTADAVARHILETGSEDYHESFERYLEDPQGYSARAALSLTSANGGYLVPFTLDPTIILTNAGSANPFRQISNVKTTATNDWNGVTSAGVNAGWLAEGTEDSDHSPTFGNLKITPQKASAWLYGSYEVLEDSDFSVQLPDLLADAKDRLEEAAFATGTGSGQPKGVVPAATTVASAAVRLTQSVTFTTPRRHCLLGSVVRARRLHGLRTRPSSTRRGSLTPLAVRPSGPTLAWVNPRNCWVRRSTRAPRWLVPPRLAPRTCFWVTSASTTSWIASACRCSTNPW